MKDKCRHRDELYRRLGHILLKELQRTDVSRGASLQKRIRPRAENQPVIF